MYQLSCHMFYHWINYFMFNYGETKILLNLKCISFQSYALSTEISYNFMFNSGKEKIFQNFKIALLFQSYASSPDMSIA